MRLRNVAVIAVVVLVALSGCAGLGPQADDPSNDTDGVEDADDAGNDSAGPDSESSANEPDENASDPGGESDDGSADEAGANTTDGAGSSDADEDRSANGSDEESNESDGEDATGSSDEANGNESSSDRTEDDTDDETGDDDTDGNETEGNESNDENSGGLEDRTDDEDAGGDGADDGDDTVDDTADTEWTPPEEPNRPLERKDDDADRIKSIEFVDTEPASGGEGYSNFNLEVVANTSMESVDPPEHGDVIGEPYFFVKINEGADDQKIVERTGEVEMTENGTFHIPVRPDGLTEFGEREDLTVEVFLVDEDKDWDDVYDAGSETIHFNPDDAGNGTDETDE